MNTSYPSFAKQQLELTKFYIFWRTCAAIKTLSMNNLLAGRHTEQIYTVAKSVSYLRKIEQLVLHEVSNTD